MTSFDPLQPLTEDIFLYEPQEIVRDRSSKQPSLVIVFEFTLHRSSVIRGRLRPARDAIRRILTSSATASDDATKGNILLHMFSNGGCSTAIQLALSIKASAADELPLGAIILDCCPGDTDFRRNYQAAVHSLPASSAPVRLAGQALLYPTIAAGTGLQHVGIMRSVEYLREQLNDPAVFGNVPRLYMYSERDQTVPHRCVQSHIKEARAKGYRVDEVKFSKGDHFLPDFNTKSHAHIIPPLERSRVTTVDLITLDTLEIAKRAHVPPADVRRLCAQVIHALHHDVGFQDVNNTEEPGSSLNIDGPLTYGPDTQLDLSQWSAISTLDPALDALLNGGIPTRYLTEVTGESGSGKTQFLLTLLLAVQLPAPRGLNKSAVYISTEAPLATPRLEQMLECHPYLSTLSKGDNKNPPSLENILSINAMDLESQDHILNYQLPVAIARYNVGLVVIDSITANYRAEHSSHSLLGLSTRSGELTKLGQLLRNLAAKENIAVVVANQVSDRFEVMDNTGGGAGPAPYRVTTSTPYQSSPSTQIPPPLLNRDSVAAASPLSRPSRPPPESSNVELSQPAVILPSSPPIHSSSPYPAEEDPQQQQFDGSYIVGNPVRNEILGLLHQQRFFTGWGDTTYTLPTNLLSQHAGAGAWRQPLQQQSQKTPALGLVWSTQIACRIALKKEERHHLHIMDQPVLPIHAPSHPSSSSLSTALREFEPPSKKNSKDQPTATDRPTRTVLGATDEQKDPPISNSQPVRVSDAAHPPSSQVPLPTPDSSVRRTMKLVFAPWAAETVDEVPFTIWKGGLQSERM
ncbi:hypothetical protein FE257_000717 [Aspergillus nanangensis]|uniref:RecA family profile 1 domain-containing protein n=1 Tax=Aspergillus nanangensis TaxID=2582783 RepID=A0AAD4CG71_ASPNN|nr:hypothetical protein FE257_000717 [Aspergillus nanangensis]